MAKDEIVVSSFEKDDYLVLRHGAEKVTSLVKDNVGRNLGEFDIDKATNPSKKSTRWEIPGVTEEPEFTNNVTGIVVFHKNARAMYEKSYDESGGGERPMCSSKDGFTGEGNPGGNCEVCPFSKFTEDKDGNSVKPKCKLVHQVYLLRPNEVLPTLFNVTAVNVPNAERYFIRLVNKGMKRFNHVVTKMELTGAVSKGGHDYAEYKFSAIADVPPEMQDEMDAYEAFLTPVLSEIELTSDDFDDDPIQEPPL